jgi:hypothetical protein
LRAADWATGLYKDTSLHTAKIERSQFTVRETK